MSAVLVVWVHRGCIHKRGSQEGRHRSGRRQHPDQGEKRKFFESGSGSLDKLVCRAGGEQE